MYRAGWYTFYVICWITRAAHTLAWLCLLPESRFREKKDTAIRSYIKHLGIVRVARLVSHSPGMRGWSSATTYCGVPWERRPRYDWILYQEVLERPKGNYLRRSASEFIARDGSYITTGHDGRRRVCHNFPRDCEGTALLRNIEEMTRVSSRVELSFSNRFFYETNVPSNKLIFDIVWDRLGTV